MSDQIPTRTATNFIRDFLLSDEVFAHYDEMVAQAQLDPNEVVPFLSSLISQYVDGLISLEMIQEQLELDLGLTQTQARDLLLQVLLRILSPIQSEIPGFGDEMLAWRSKVSAVTSPSEQTSLQWFVSAYAEALSPPDLQRLTAILRALIDGARSKEETVAFLQRSHKVGGLEMSEQQAQEMVVRVMNEVNVEEPTPIPTPVSSEEEFPALLTQADEAELVTSTQTATQLIADQPGLSPDQLVEKICQHESFHFDNPLLQSRCQDIIQSRLRDVRGAEQTRQAFEKSVEAGGLGMTGRRLADMTEQVERAVEVMQETHRTDLMAKRAASAEQKQASHQAKQTLVEKETQVLSKRFVDKTGKMPSQVVEPAAPALARTTAARSHQEELATQEQAINTEKVRQVIESTKQTPPKRPVKQKTQMQDVRPMPRLSGPVDELGVMGITEFRRLAKDPVQATARIEDLVNLLDEQGYEIRVKGIRAFQSSPLMRAYATLTQQALLTGTSVDTLLAQTPDTFTPPEYQALRKLSAALRF